MRFAINPLTGLRYEPRLFMAPDGTQGGSLPKDDSDIDALTDLDDAAKTRLKEQRRLARAEADRANNLQTQLDQLTQQVQALTADKTKLEADARKQAQKDAKDAGNFEAEATRLAGELETVTGERDALQGKVTALSSAVDNVVKADFDSLPDPVKAAYLGGDDPLQKLAFLPHAKTLAEAIKPAGETPQQPVQPSGTTQDPPPNGNTTSTKLSEADENARRLNAMRYQ